jgi:hypothetical protein
MISAVTPSTVSAVTTAALAGSVAWIGIIVLLTLLVQKELTSATTNRRLLALAQILNVGIAPLMIAFGLLVAARIAEVLR